jgi:hypothetical protein
MLEPAQKYCCCFNNSNVSKLNVENVLKPPQIPVKMNIFKLGFAWILSLNAIKVIAKIRQLKTLEDRVAIGRVSDDFEKAKPNKYLIRHPKPPPKKTNTAPIF